MANREYRVELHIHTRFSHDSLLPLWLLYVVCRLRKINCVAITDHNEIKGALRFQQHFSKVAVIVGEEIFSAEGEIIGMFLHEKIDPGLPASETIKRIHEQNGVVCIPHPADTKRVKTVLQTDALLANLDQIHCIESYNGRTLLQEDITKQREIAEKSGIPCVVGGDAHTFYELGRNYLVCASPVQDKETFLTMLPQAECHTAPCLPIAHQSTKIARAVKLIAIGKFQELISSIAKKGKR